jgi:hypothetical protein
VSADGLVTERVADDKAYVDCGTLVRLVQPAEQPLPAGIKIKGFRETANRGGRCVGPGVGAHVRTRSIRRKMRASNLPYRNNLVRAANN